MDAQWREVGRVTVSRGKDPLSRIRATSVYIQTYGKHDLRITSRGTLIGWLRYQVPAVPVRPVDDVWRLQVVSLPYGLYPGVCRTRFTNHDVGTSVEWARRMVTFSPGAILVLTSGFIGGPSRSHCI